MTLQNQYFLKIIVIVVILSTIILFCKAGGHTKDLAVKKLGKGLSACWDDFKKENCDLNNPVGPFCKKLLECTLSHQSPESKGQLKDQESDSLIEEFCGILIVIATVYISGWKKTLEFLMFLVSSIRSKYLEKQRKEENKDN